MNVTKGFRSVTIKDADLGLVEAVFATYGVVDLDGDLTVKGALPIGAPVVISAYGHGSHSGKLPVGKGVIVEQGDDAILKGEFFMDTSDGRDTFAVVKSLSEDDLQEWSYSLQDIEAERVTIDGQKVRKITKVAKVKEVSPVLIGAGVNTRTLATKGAESKQFVSDIRSQIAAAAAAQWGADGTYVWPLDYDLDELIAIVEIEDSESIRLVQVDIIRDGDTISLGTDETDVERVTQFVPAKSGARLVEHSKSVVADVELLVERATEVMALRAEKGKGIADDTLDQLKELVAGLTSAAAAVETLTSSDAPTTTRDAEAEYLRFVAQSQ